MQMSGRFDVGYLDLYDVRVGHAASIKDIR
jgi:hypothetical protein